MSFDKIWYCLILVSSVMKFKFVKSDLTELDNADFELQNKDANFEKVFAYAINTCKIKERASDSDIENIENNFLPTTLTEKCFVACWLETFHVIKNRRFFREQYVKLSTYGQNLNENAKNVLRNILKNCKLDPCRLNRCELAFRIMKCISDGAAKLNVDPKTL